MMKQREFILHPHPEEIFDKEGADVLTKLTKLWNREANGARTDFERLYGSGQLSRIYATPGVDATLRDWLEQTSAPKALDVAASFLMGRWAGGTGHVDEGLVRALVGALESEPVKQNGVDAAVSALGASYDRVEDKNLKERIKRKFKDLWEGSGPDSAQPGVRNALRYVLRPPK
jgi:hypothetical protein